LLLDGGNAFDAAVAVASALNVVEPYMSGLAGVGYALVYVALEDRVRCLDYCGPTPYSASLESCPSQMAQEVGPRSCLVPGACAGWLALLERYGSRPREAVFAPAIELAEKGFAITVRNARFISESRSRLHPTGAQVVLADGAPPPPGHILVQADLGSTLRRVVEEGQSTFYGGDVGREIVRCVQEAGGLLADRDLAEFEPVWQEPVGTRYRGHDVLCPPAPSSGFQILETLNLLEAYPVAEIGPETEVALHLFIEAVKLANADRVEYAAAHPAPVEGLLSKPYAEERRRLIGPLASVSRGEYYAPDPLPGEVPAGNDADWTNECTTHFDVVDADGNAVSVTQSLGSGFGSGMVMGSTGLFLNNFIKWADRTPGSPNCVGPHKKLDMCLSPCLVMRDGRLVSALGTPGSWGIQQTTVQFLTNFVDHGMNIQAAIEAPRFRLEFPGKRIYMEARFPEAVRAALERRGHEIDLLPDWSPMVGGAQGIVVDPASGAMMGGADPRRDGYALGI